MRHHLTPDSIATLIVIGLWVVLIIVWSLSATSEPRKANREWRKARKERSKNGH